MAWVGGWGHIHHIGFNVAGNKESSVTFMLDIYVHISWVFCSDTYLLLTLTMYFIKICFEIFYINSIIYGI